MPSNSSPPADFLSSDQQAEKIERDEFNTRKIIVALSNSGKIFGLDSKNGDIIWSHYPGSNFHFSLQQIVFTRPTAHLNAECVFIGALKGSSNSVLLLIDAVTGRSEFKDGIVKLGYQVKQRYVLPHVDKAYRHILLLMDTENSIHTYPFSAENVVKVIEEKNRIFIYNIDSNLQSIQGFGLQVQRDQQKILGDPIWNIEFPNDEKIEKIAAKTSGSRIGSLGRVLPDRSVAYKYLNPNLLACLTLSKTNGSLGVYLIDTVKGTVVFKCRHEHASQPANIIQIENLVVYSFRNTQSYRNEISVLEMDDEEVNVVVDHPLQSSFRPHYPLVGRQSYVFPKSIEVIQVSRTRLGVTPKQFLFGLSSGSLFAADRKFLDPRRVIGATSMTPEMEALP
eukprot:Sdes_comp19871_c0_seq1m12150